MKYKMSNEDIRTCLLFIETKQKKIRNKFNLVFITQQLNESAVKLSAYIKPNIPIHMCGYNNFYRVWLPTRIQVCPSSRVAS